MTVRRSSNSQIAQAIIEGAQLRVVERSGHFFTIAGDERHGRAPVEQGYRGRDLILADTEFLCDLSVDETRHGRSFG